MNYLDLLKKIKEREDQQALISAGKPIEVSFLIRFIVAYRSSYDQFMNSSIVDFDEEDIAYFKAKCLRVLQKEKEDQMKKLAESYDAFL